MNRINNAMAEKGLEGTQWISLNKNINEHTFSNYNERWDDRDSWKSLVVRQPTDQNVFYNKSTFNRDEDMK